MIGVGSRRSLSIQGLLAWHASSRPHPHAATPSMRVPASGVSSRSLNWLVAIRHHLCRASAQGVDAKYIGRGVLFRVSGHRAHRELSRMPAGDLSRPPRRHPISQRHDRPRAAGRLSATRPLGATCEDELSRVDASAPPNKLKTCLRCNECSASRAVPRHMFTMNIQAALRAGKTRASPLERRCAPPI